MKIELILGWIVLTIFFGLAAYVPYYIKWYYIPKDMWIRRHLIRYHRKEVRKFSYVIYVKTKHEIRINQLLKAC